MILAMPMSMPKLRFQYLDPDSIIGSPDFLVVESFLKITERTQIGWHYIVDLTWIYSRAKHWPVGLRVLDAGGGSGPTQFLLAEMGMDVVNIDLVYRAAPLYYDKRYGLQTRRLDSYVETDYLAHLHSSTTTRPRLGWLRQSMARNTVVRQLRYRQYRHRHDHWRHMAGFSGRPVGQLTRLCGNLCHIPEIPAESFDAIVSLSALEHVPMAQLPTALKEIDRVLKPDAYRAITTAATDKPTWYHEPSAGLCFDQIDLERVFGAQLNGAADVSAILEKYRASPYLYDHLADFYKVSGKNGMPWGKWDPQYVPVGIRE